MRDIGFLFWLFLAYSFGGWVLETVFTAIRKREFVNRGFLNGPLCAIYGVAGVWMHVFLADLAGNWVFLYLGCAVVAFITELLTGRLLEHFGIGRWWDYSGRKFNLGGHVCLEAAAFWGLLGLVSMTWVDPVLELGYSLVPGLLRNILLLVSLGIVVIDVLGSWLVLRNVTSLRRVVEADARIDAATKRLSRIIANWVVGRLERAHPQATAKKKKKAATVFAPGCGFAKLFLLMVIGAFLGDIVETIFVGLTSGVIMSRSSLVWGPFSMVWGIAISLATAMLYRYRDRSDGFLFFFGTVLGGAYEYFCSVFTELAFGTVFWDYSHFPLNLGGRINLLYCFFWGIAAVVWLKKLFPLVSKWIERIPKRVGNAALCALVVFFCVDIAVTCGAMARYSQRQQEIAPKTSIGIWLDEAFDDGWMEHRYQNMKLTQ